MQADRIAGFLPLNMQRAVPQSPPMQALLAVAEAFLDPVDQELERIEDHVSPLHCRDDEVPVLASWMDLGHLLDEHIDGHWGFAAGSGRLRLLVAEARRLSRARGTPAGLQAYLSCATGIAGFRIEENPPDAAGHPRPFHFTVTVPIAAAQHRRLIERIVAAEKPASVTCDIRMEPPAGAHDDDL